MRKSDLILQHLAGIDGTAGVSDIAAAIGDVENGGTSRTSALLSNLQKRRYVTREGTRSDGGWRITPGGCEALAEATEDTPPSPSDSPRKVVHEAAPPKNKRVAKKAKKAKGAKSPRGKLQRRTAKVQPAETSVAVVELASIGRSIAIREDGAVLVLEDNAVVTTLIPEDALKIARVIQALSGARA